MPFYATIRPQSDGWGWPVRTDLGGNARQVLSGLDQARANLLRVVKGVPQDQLWRRVGPTIPTMGNLLLHLAGTEHQWIGEKVGKLPLHRDRPLEFGCTGGITLPQLLARWDQVRQQTDQVIGVFAKGGRAMTPEEAHCFHYTAQHFAYHCGQIVVMRKVFTPEYSVYPA